MTHLGWLTLGAFAIGTEGFMIAGLLPAIARDLNADLAAAGFLVTAFSLAYAVGAPVIAVLTAGLERRRLLAFGMSGFSIANLIAALAPGYAGLLAARLLLALSAACFMPAASGRVDMPLHPRLVICGIELVLIEHEFEMNAESAGDWE